MCVIIVKPSGEKMPDKTILWQCWQFNPDGAGYMFQRNNRVVVSKGYMHFEDLEIALQEVSHIVKDTTLVIHFRLATAGKVNRANTHPFPVSTKDKELACLDIETESALAHNGVLPNVWGKKALKKHSDSFMFAKTISHLPQGQALYDMLELMAQTSHSRFALLNGDVHLFGEWEEYNGCIYSNLNFLYARIKNNRVWEIVNPNTGKATGDFAEIAEDDFYNWKELGCPVCEDGWLDDCYQFFYCSSCGTMIDYEDPRLDGYWAEFDNATLPSDTPEEDCQLELDLQDEGAETAGAHLHRLAPEEIREKLVRWQR